MATARRCRRAVRPIRIRRVDHALVSGWPVGRGDRPGAGRRDGVGPTPRPTAPRTHREPPARELRRVLLLHPGHRDAHRRRLRRAVRLLGPRRPVRLPVPGLARPGVHPVLRLALRAGPPGRHRLRDGPARAPLGSGPGVRDRPGPHTPAAVPLIASGGPARLTGPPPTARFARLGLRLRRILVDTPYPAGPTLLP